MTLARIAVYLDGLAVVTRLFSVNWETPAGYIYAKVSTLWFFSTVSFSIMNITCCYIASMLSHLLCAFIVAKQSHLILRSTMRGISIVVNIYQIIVTVVVG